MQPEPHLIFSDFRDLLRALHALTGEARYPPSVLRVGGDGIDRGWAVPQGLFPEAFELLRKQHGWNVERTPDRPVGETVRLADAIGGKWRYSDPFHHDIATYGGLRDEAISRYDAHDPKVQHVLAAWDEGHARRLLDALLGEKLSDLSVAPLLPVSECPFCCFWLVRETRPSPHTIRLAARAWWGPLGSDRLQLFQEWSRFLDIPETCLARIDWGTTSGFVLLSPQDPQRIIVRPATQAVWQPLIHVADLHPGNPSVVEVRAPGHVRFDVALKLRRKAARSVLQQRILDLERDIAGKQELLDDLRRRAVDEEAGLVYYEPLLVFAAPRGRCPFGLRRLLVEWADSPADLGALLYAKCATNWLEASPGSGTEDQELHMVLSSAALHPGGSRGVGLRLREYARPVFGASETCHHFELAREWTGYGLRMFLPYDWQFELFPHFDPGPVAAEKLKAALHLDPGSAIAVVVRGAEGSVRVHVIQEASFQPLRAAFEWQCAVHLGDTPPPTYHRAGRGVQENFVSSVAAAVERATQSELCARLDAVVSALAQQVDEIDTLRSGLVQLIDPLARDLPRAHSTLAEVKTTIGRASRVIAEIESKLARRNQVDQVTRRLRTRLDRLRGRVRSLNRDRDP